MMYLWVSYKKKIWFIIIIIIIKSLQTSEESCRIRIH